MREHDALLEEVIRAENQVSASNQVPMVNIFTSFRTIGSLNWKTWVEKMSRVHHVLQGDPAKIYQLGDFITRDQYRHRIEIRAQRVPRPETAFAEDSVNTARQGLGQGQAGTPAAP